MDRIRYRLYDRHSRSLSSVGIIEYLPDGNVRVNRNIILTTDHKIVFSTGYRDKNNRLIFEGDLINYYHSPKDKITGLVEEGTGNFVLISRELKQKNFSVRANHSKCEVIGNKYQNNDILIANKVKVFL